MGDTNILLSHFWGAALGDETGGGETIEQVNPLLLDGEEIEIATRGESGGAAFTNLRLILVNNAGLFKKRSIISFIRTASIDVVSVDAGTLFEVKLAGRGFDGAYLLFNDPIDKIKLTRWLSNAVSQQ
ncbi:hypothetical protein NAP1_10027 [Erythrobacter sp. NAP1]|uniref:PH domain-containing protein n=1 Tax=Erythrobacter sp. NAP1 TaxID=237727 RepID=UPI00006851E7|nr:PH domain-containing protein [Erythrobacter sp. NAP1]EAQ27924.1 hypothetical protein NAP1_10027 [Erythrobacter sp. NAP1]